MISIPTSANGNKANIADYTRQAIDLKDRIMISPGLAETRRLEKRLHDAEAEIDRLVYELYGLTEKEIRIIEGSE